MSSLSQRQMQDISRLDSFFGDEEQSMPVLLLTPRWSPVIRVDPTTDDLCFVEEGDLVADVLHVRAFVDEQLVQFSIPVTEKFLPGAYELNPDGSMAVFGLRQLGPETWLVQPSVNIPGQIHAFVILCGVPDPSPWHCMQPRKK